MSSNKAFKFFRDPGHGWLEIPKSLVRMSRVEISEFSYERGKMAYLEEDCDAPKFLKRMESVNVIIETQDIHLNNESEIRNYEQYQN